jgi:hypothetical protein
MGTIRLMRPPPSVLHQHTYLATNRLTVITNDVDGLRHAQSAQGAMVATSGRGPMVLWPYEHEKVRVSVSVVVEAGPPQVIARRLVVPDEPRRHAECALGEYADVLAVALQCKRALRSPQPAVALAPSQAEEEGVFRDALGLHQEFLGTGTAPRVMPADVLTDPTFAAAFVGRLDGLALLADSLGEDGVAARARELFRLFERAFRSGPSETVNPLTEFLQAAPRQDAIGYERDEVAYWLEHLRAESVHADRRPSYARSPDIEPYLGRMEYAAYDVLFNKARWRHKSADRRPQLEFASGLARDKRTLVFLQRGASLLINWMDPYNAYPTDWEARTKLPPEWIWKLPGQDDV